MNILLSKKYCLLIRKPTEKISFLKNVKISLKARGDVLNSFKSNLFPIMSDTSINKEYFMSNTISQQKRTGLKRFTT